MPDLSKKEAKKEDASAQRKAYFAEEREKASFYEYFRRNIFSKIRISKEGRVYAGANERSGARVY